MEHQINLVSEMKIDDGVIAITQKIGEQVSCWALDTHEKQVRAGLIALGWTPPRTPTANGEGE